MLYNCYLRSGIVYVPTVAKMELGVYSDEEPVAVVPLANTEGLRRAFLDAIGRGNKIIPIPPKNNWPPPVLLKYAGVKTWSAFMRGASTWNIKEVSGHYEISGHRIHRKGYWEQDPDQKIEFPPGTEIDEVIERMIALVQAAGRR